jgi:hypothetical protein
MVLTLDTVPGQPPNSELAIGADNTEATKLEWHFSTSL